MAIVASGWEARGTRFQSQRRGCALGVPFYKLPSEPTVSHKSCNVIITYNHGTPPTSRFRAAHDPPSTLKKSVQVPFEPRNGRMMGRLRLRSFNTLRFRI